MVKRHWSARKFVRSGLMIVISVALIFGAFRLSTAGSLTPSASPAGTLNALNEIWNVLASDSYDSSGISADPNGSAIQISKCIIVRLQGGTCP